MARRKKVDSVDIVSELTDDKPIEHKDSDILKVEILKCFFDKYTDKLYEVGKIYNFTYKRIKEIKNKNEKLIKVLEK